jgi:Virulence factor
MHVSEIQVTYWREIPSMVVARQGEEVAKVQLPQRFQEAIDEAAMRLGESSADDYMAGWTRSAWEEFGGDPVDAAQQRSEALDNEWTQERLDAYLDSLG